MTACTCRRHGVDPKCPRHGWDKAIRWGLMTASDGSYVVVAAPVWERVPGYGITYRPGSS